MPIGWSWFITCIHLERAYFKARGIKKDSVPDMIEIELTSIHVKSGIVYPDVDGSDEVHLRLNESLSKTINKVLF